MSQKNSCPTCGKPGFNPGTNFAPAVALGKLGGLAGKGEAKRRPPEHYRAGQLKGVETKRRKRATVILANTDGASVSVKNS